MIILISLNHRVYRKKNMNVEKKGRRQMVITKALFYWIRTYVKQTPIITMNGLKFHQ